MEDIVLFGDALDKLKLIKSESIDLIITSPPYADQRIKVYGGVHPDLYTQWFLPISTELKRVLKKDGTFILNIKEKILNGERHTYVLELILSMKKQGWLWTEEFIWHKKNSYPGKWPNRFRDSWERLLQFNKQKKFNMYQDEVKVPIGDWAKTRLKNMSDKDLLRQTSKVGSNFGKKISNWKNKTSVYPTNVLHLSTECGNRGHSAVFPKALPQWFIRLFSKENDTILDPFCGSGTALVVAKELNRKYIGIEKNEEYEELISNNLRIRNCEGIQADRKIYTGTKG